MGVSKLVTPAATWASGRMRLRIRAAAPRAVAVMILVLLAAGCQTAGKATNRRIIDNQALIDFSGLAPSEPIDGVKVSCSVARQWEAVPLKRTALYAHQQWRSP